MTAPGFERAAPPRALWVTLAALSLLRAALAMLPSMAGWGLNFSRFMDPALAWGLWAAGALALAPPLGRRATAALDALVRFARRAPALTVVLPALAGGALVLALPDRVWFVGDFLLRVGILQEPEGFGRMFPQALPLDRLLHYVLPRAIGETLHADPQQVARALGGFEIVGLAAIAVRFARGLDLRGAAAAAVAGVVMFGGAFALDAGYGKPTIEIGLLTLVIGTCGLDMVRSNRGLLGCGIAMALALGLHRAALALLPGFVAAWALWFTSHGRSGAWRRPRVAVALAIPVVTLAVLAPALIRLVAGFDVAVNFRSAEVAQQGGMLHAALAPLKLLDLMNLLVLLCPLAPIVPVLLLAHGRRPPRGRELLLLAALALGFVPALLFVYVTQGPFRDWDAFTGAGAACSLLAAWWLAETLRSAPRHAWLAAPALLATVVPTLTVLISHHDLERGLARARAFLTESPRRTWSQRVATWDWLGLRCLRLGRWSEAASAYAEVSRAAPHPRALLLWGTAATIAGDYPGGETAFRSLVGRDAANPEGWFGLWIASSLAGDTAAAGPAGRRIHAYADDGPEMARILAHLEHYPALWERMRIADRAAPGGAPPAVAPRGP